MAGQCYCAALGVAARKLSALYDDTLAPVGITVAQFRLLRLVARAPARWSLTALGRVAELDRSTIGRNVRLLQRLGLVRMVTGADHRETAVELSEGGGRTLREAMPLWNAAQRRIEALLGADTAAQLRSLLQSL